MMIGQIEEKREQARRDRAARRFLAGMRLVAILVFAAPFVWFAKWRWDAPKRASERAEVKSMAQARLSPEQRRKQEIERGFSALDGSHRELTQWIKRAMHDPGSFDHVRTVYFDQGDHLVVITSYRGKNAWGARVLGSVKARCGLDGGVLEIIEGG